MSFRTLVRQSQLLLEQRFHEAREALHALTADGPADFVALEERLLMSATPTPAPVAEQPAEAVTESGDEAAQATQEQQATPGAPTDEELVELVSAAVGPVVASPAAETSSADTPAETQRLELVFVDSRVPDADAWLADLQGTEDDSVRREVVLLDADRDGIAQISAALLRFDMVDGIHIVSHGTNGEVLLGNTVLSLETMDRYQSAISAWQYSLTQEADLLFYGCDLAATDAGRELMEQVAAASNSDVAASDDLTGHEDLGGDWDLEFQSGEIETQIAVSRDMQGAWYNTLATLSTTAIQDSWLDDGSQTTNYGSDSSMTVDSSGGSIGNGRAVIQFDVSSIPVGSTINSAELRLHATANGGAFDINVYAITESWTEGGVSWDNRSGGTSWSSSGGSYDATIYGTSNNGATGQHTWDVTTLVQEWYDGTRTNYGLLLGSPDGGTTQVTYDSRSGTNFPILAIDYTPPNTAPQIGELDGDTPSFTEDVSLIAIDTGAAVTITDDSADFDGGTLTVTTTANGTANDRLSVSSSSGSGPGDVNVVGSTVRYNFGAGMVTVGSVSGGTSGSDPLVVTFNASSSPDAARAILRHVSFYNVSDAPSTADRTLEVVLTDGDGGTSSTQTLTLSVTGANDAPSGVPVITGTATEDQTLTADVSGISDPDGITPGTFTYQWLRDGGAIFGANASTYTLGDDDVGTQISVRVGYDDDGGTTEGPLTSAQTAAVANINDVPTLDNSTNLQLSAITEDEYSNSGNSVAQILASGGGDPITDPDGGQEGIALTATGGSNGTWQYSLDGGTTWTDVGSVSSTSALLLRDTDRLRFRPDGTQGTTGSLAFRAWDVAAGGTAGTLANTMSGSIYSVDSEVVSLTVSAVNDPATISALAGDMQTYTEGSGAQLIDQGSSVTVSDVDSADLNGGSVTVSITSGRIDSEDVLAVRNQGTGAGQIGVSGSNITYNAGGGTVVIGTMSGGTGANDLTITLTSAAADPAALSALLQNITYENTNTTSATSGTRVIGFVINDGDGGTSSLYQAGVTVGTPTNTITFQQLINGYVGTRDTFLFSDAPSSTHGAEVEVDVDLDVSSGDDGTAHGLIQFGNIFGNGVGQIPAGSQIISASLTLHVTNPSSSGSQIQLHRMLTSWSESSTWNSLGAGVQTNGTEAAITADGAVPSPNATGAQTITGLEATVQAWSDGTANNGWVIISDSSNGWDFHSSESATPGFRPVLTIEYASNTAPQIADLGGDIANHTEGGPVVTIDTGTLATVTDDSANFSGGALTVTTTANGTANDRLTVVSSSGTGPGDVSVSGSTIRYNFGAGLVTVGSMSGGSDGSTPLTVTFNANATSAAAQAILRNVAYHNVSDSPSTAARTLEVVLTDGDGGSSIAQSVSVNVAGSNDAPSGAPTITGTATEDQTLTADVSGISDVDGITPGTFTYQWLRDGAVISGATASTYTLTDADVGTQISVRVGYDDDGGTTEGPLTSAATASVSNVNDAPAGLPVITGTATEDQTLTADVSSISDADGITPGTFTYQWLRDGAVISGATSGTYTLTDADVGTQISVRVGFDDDGGATEGPLTSVATTAVSNVNDAPAGLPVITGTATEDQTLTADVSGISDADGITPGTFTYQWLRDGAVISGATSGTYTLTDADVGTQISVRVGFDDDGGATEGPLTSVATTAVSNVNDAPAGLPVITGTATEDQTLTADVSGISDVDGITPGTFTYQWLRDGAVISGATSGTYTLTDADVGTQISVRVGFDDDGGATEGPLTSTGTAAVTNVNDVPVGLPTVVGTATEDQTLTADVSGISDADGITPGTFTYQWLRDGAVLSGATSSTYSLTDADVGTQISVRVRYDDDGGATEGPLTSTATAAIASVNDSPVGIPAITGTTQEDQTLTADISGVSDVDGINVATHAFQWFRNGMAISGATSSTYTLGDADVGAAITVQFSYDDHQGSSEGPLTSAQTAPILNVNDSPVIATNTGMTVAEGSTGNVLTTAMLNEGDVDDDGVELTYTLMVNVSGGTLNLAGFGPLSLGDTFTQDDIDNNRVTYDHGGSDTPSDSFSFALADGLEDGATAAVGAFTISITAVNDAPQVTSPATVTVTEDVASPVGGISISDVDAAGGDVSVRLSVSNGVLTLDTTGVTITNGGNNASTVTIRGTVSAVNSALATLNYQGITNLQGTAADSLSILVDDLGNSGAGGPLTDSASVQIDITNVNDEQLLSRNTGITVLEGDTGIPITRLMLEATDVDNTDAQLVFTLTSIPGTGTLRLSGVALSVSDTFTQADITAGRITYDHNDAEVFTDSFNFSVDDGAGTATTGTFAITIVSVNDNPPVVTAGQTFNVAEHAANGTVVGSVLATDVDNVGTLSNWQITAGNTDAIFTIDATSGRITVADNTALNFETRSTWTLTVTVSDGIATSATETITINVLDENDAPVLNSAGPFFLDENSAAGTSVGQLTSSDEDAVDTASYSIVAGNVGAAFTINSSTGELTVATPAALDFETLNTWTLDIRVQDAGGLSDTQSFTVTLNDVNEVPVDLQLTGGSVPENSATGTQLGQLSVTDVDAGDTASWTLLDNAGGRFAVDSATGLLTVANGTLLDFETDTSHTIVVRATDSGGLSRVESFSVTITNVNEAPVAQGENLEAEQVQTLFFTSGSLLDNDTDIDGDTLQAVLDSGPDNGTLQLNADGTFEYTPTGTFFGTDTFSYYVTDGSLDSAIVTVTLDVLPVGGGSGMVDQTPDEPDRTDDSVDDDSSDTHYLNAAGLLNPDADEDYADHRRQRRHAGQDTGALPGQANGFAGGPLDADTLAEQQLASYWNTGPETTRAEREERVVDRTASPEQRSILGNRIESGPAFTSLFLEFATTDDNDQPAHQALADMEFHELLVGGASVAVSTGFSVGYVAWILRGSSLVTVFMSSLPAWQSFDPLPIISDRDVAEDEDDESLQSIVS